MMSIRFTDQRKSCEEVLEMKKALSLISICLMVIFVAADAFAQSPSQTLLNSTWKGDLTILHVDGTTTTLAASTLTFATKNGNFLSGTISDPAVEFSAISGFDFAIFMTAPNYKISAEIRRGFRRHGIQGVDTMQIQGSNFTDGSMFVGTLTRQ
jgi:hypothetical protein